MRYSEYVNRAHKLRLELFKNPDYEKLLSIIQQASNIMQEVAFDPDVSSGCIRGISSTIGYIIESAMEDIRKCDPIPGRCKDCEYLEVTGPYAECRFTTSILTPDGFCDRFRKREGRNINEEKILSTLDALYEEPPQ